MDCFTLCCMSPKICRNLQKYIKDDRFEMEELRVEGKDE